MPGGPGGPRPPMPQLHLRRSGPLVPTLVILAIIIVLVSVAAQWWTEVLWFDSVGFTKVFWIELSTKIGLFVVCGLFTAVVVASSLLIGYRTRPVYPPAPGGPENPAPLSRPARPAAPLGYGRRPSGAGLFCRIGRRKPVAD